MKFLWNSFGSYTPAKSVNVRAPKQVSIPRSRKLPCGDPIWVYGFYFFDIDLNRFDKEKLRPTRDVMEFFRDRFSEQGVNVSGTYYLSDGKRLVRPVLGKDVVNRFEALKKLSSLLKKCENKDYLLYDEYPGNIVHKHLKTLSESREVKSDKSLKGVIQEFSSPELGCTLLRLGNEINYMQLHFNMGYSWNIRKYVPDTKRLLLLNPTIDSCGVPYSLRDAKNKDFIRDQETGDYKQVGSIFAGTKPKNSLEWTLRKK